MNTRILRMCELHTIGARTRRVVGLGQLQPVLFSVEPRRGPTLRIESVAQARPCWRVLPLPGYRAEAKRLFAELEACKARGEKSPAWQVWEAAK